MKKSEITVLGSLNVDLTINLPRFHVPGETITGTAFHTFLGGKGGNQAVAAAKLGGKVHMIGCVGQDAYGDMYLKEMERLGGKATVLEFQKGEADFSTMMATIKSAGYDGIFAPVSIETAAMIISQARDSGVTCPIMAGDTWDDISIAQRTGDKATDIFFSAFFDADDTTNEAGKAFVEGFKAWVAEDNTRIENNGGTAEAISSVTPCGYDAYMAAVYAIEAAGSTDGVAIRDALVSLNVPGLITGDLSFDENGDAVKTYAVIKTIKDGEIVYYSTYNG